MMFPVAAFHYFNNPQLFEKSVINIKKHSFPKMNEDDINRIMNLKKSRKIEYELKRIEQLEESQKKKKNLQLEN
jgi:hypothetical protein